MTQHALDFSAPTARQAAETRRDLGIERAGEHADRVRALWRETAARLIRDYGRMACKPFLIEDVVPYAKRRGLEDPPDGRAWGAAAKLAKRSGYIEACGYAPANTSNRSPKVLWRAG